jgi:predicted N-acyltransferase
MNERLAARIGGRELLEDFYLVFTVNRRDIGSLVQSKGFIREVLAEFADRARLVEVCKARLAVAAAMIAGFRDTLWNPWSSSLKHYAALSPNMLLCWTVLEHACASGYKFFEFGRSTTSEGTYKFKRQWGPEPAPLQWHYLSRKGFASAAPDSADPKFALAGRLWSRLPVAVTRLLGSAVRKHISL